MNLKLKINSVAIGRSRRLGLAPVARGRSRRLRIGLRVPPGGARAIQKGVSLRAHKFEIKIKLKLN